MRRDRHRFSLVGALAILVAAAAPAAATDQARSTPQLSPAVAADLHADDVVVTAQRSSIPVWRVQGPRTTVVLVGSISAVSPDTRWNPEALDAALAQADRVMFPQSVEIGAGLFSIIGAVAKWHGQGTLPASQTLQSITTPEQWARLVALRDRGILKPGLSGRTPITSRSRSSARSGTGADRA